jgi:ASC-1-like (ASCH) protein
MIRVYFVFEDPLDDSGINLSFADVPTTDPDKALRRVHDAARSGELWRILYPDDQERRYSILDNKMSYLDISTLPNESNADTVLPL